MSYDDNNIFAKILRGEVPCDKIYEDEYVLSFFDVNPQKKIHALVIPKGKYTNLDDFNENASEKEILGFLRGVTLVAKKLGISINNGNGYRTLSNIGSDGGQEVPHLHFHIFGGEKIGKMVKNDWNIKTIFGQYSENIHAIFNIWTIHSHFFAKYLYNIWSIYR